MGQTEHPPVNVVVNDSSSEGLEPEVYEALLLSTTATLANIMLGHGLSNTYLLGLSPLAAGQPKLIGPAYTLRFIPAREDIDSMANYASSDNLHRRAIEECPPGAVLVIDSGRCVRAASAGDVMAARLKKRGVLGMVTDGGFRDSQSIRGVGLPAFQQQAAPPATPIALHPIELNGPVGCAGVAIYPGDIIVGDEDGVVAIPAHLVQVVAREALRVSRYEEFVDLNIESGRSIFGLFPSSLESLQEYEHWVSSGKPGHSK
ncbi:ribonuclease activity regulator RraA [Pseudomonas sp. BF-R-01]|uniref:ribonuclease activity regulator RraA n=1 Tax=Pseudomonas sp. BF-R-01 TaxID=2832365 RepID=UPI001CC0C9F2|nr:ribonuclease activity regulator RraA [Pseudomonas sp. BF-R-01]